MTSHAPVDESPLYVALSTYVAPAPRVADVVPEHRSWIVGLYESGVMLASGPQVGGGGGVLIFRAQDDDTAREVVAADPLTRRAVADYRLVPFRATPLPHRSDAVQLFLSQPGPGLGSRPVDPTSEGVAP